MLSFNATHSHAILTFVASGHVVVFEAATGTPIACVRTSAGAGGQRQAHAAQPTPDDAYILVANQNGKLLDRITTDYATNTFVLDATLDLANGMTPNGVPMEFALRPDNAPIIVVPDATSTLAFITLRGGGLFVVDPTTTPIEILAEYDTTTVHASGFGGIEANGRMYINSGAGAATTNPSEFDIYRFPLSGYAASNLPTSQPQWWCSLMTPRPQRTSGTPTA
jgi:DNA-binding beta-propeller fold protein YncE